MHFCFGGFRREDFVIDFPGVALIERGMGLG